MMGRWEMGRQSSRSYQPFLPNAQRVCSIPVLQPKDHTTSAFMPRLAHFALWAKLGKETWPVQYHPLLCHLIDVAVVCRRLWEEVLRPPVKKRFADTIGLSLDDCASWVAFWVGAHDIGKASPAFQSQGKTDSLIATLREAGFDFDHSDNVPHGTVSVPALYSWLSSRSVPDSAARRISQAVGGHFSRQARFGKRIMDRRAHVHP
jgi:CRISPR-associated endonuclease Cas3-HD